MGQEPWNVPDESLASHPPPRAWGRQAACDSHRSHAAAHLLPRLTVTMLEERTREDTVAGPTIPLVHVPLMAADVEWKSARAKQGPGKRAYSPYRSGDQLFRDSLRQNCLSLHNCQAPN